MPKFTRLQTVDAYQFVYADWNSDATKEIPTWFLGLLSSGFGMFNGAGQLQIISDKDTRLKITVDDTDWIVKFGPESYGIFPDSDFQLQFQPAAVDLTAQPSPVITAAPSA